MHWNACSKYTNIELRVATFELTKKNKQQQKKNISRDAYNKPPKQKQNPLAWNFFSLSE